MAVLLLIFFFIRSVQNGSNLIKMDFSPIKKCYYKKLSHLQKGKNGSFILDFFDQICPSDYFCPDFCLRFSSKLLVLLPLFVFECIFKAS